MNLCCLQVSVYVAPTLTELPKDTEVPEGESVELVCAATGVPPPAITWKFKNQPIPGSRLEATDNTGRSRYIILHYDTLFYENVEVSLNILYSTGTCRI